MLTTAQALHSRAHAHTHALTETYIFAALSFLLPSGQRVFKVALTQATTLNPAAKLKGETGPGKGGGLSLTAFLFLFLRVLPRGGKIFKSLERGGKKKKTGDNKEENWSQGRRGDLPLECGLLNHFAVDNGI